MPKACEWPERAYWICMSSSQRKRLVVSGRDRWALEWLMRVGEQGCTTLECVGPRLSAYVFNLRQAGVEIETRHEKHDGPFSGTHGRYVLQSAIVPVNEVTE